MNRSSLKPCFGIAVAILVFCHAGAAQAEADLTRYPVVFAHGLSGFDDILGFDYWGNDWGNFVFDSCDKFLEPICNPHIDDDQRSFVATVQPFHNSELRGTQLADDIEGYMASTGASMVNIIGHSQGGIDARKAASELHRRLGRRSVYFLLSVSSPHRGTPVATAIMEDFVGTPVEGLAEIFGDVIYGAGNSAPEATMQLMPDDADPNDGRATGMTAYNQVYGVDYDHVAKYRSFLTAQSGAGLNPAFATLGWLGYSIPGPDDGVVPLGSQHMGYRMQYDEAWGRDSVYRRSDMGNLTDLNNPNSTQATSTSAVIGQDHLDVIGVGPDTFDEYEFYAAIAHYMAVNGG